VVGVGVGLIGSGFIASTYADALQDVRDAEITANYSRDPNRAAAFAAEWGPIPSQYDDIAALCADPAVDLVVISLPNEVHLEATRIAAAAGKEPRFVRIPRERILRAGGHPMGPRLYFGTYFDVPAITLVVNKAQRMLKFKPIDFAVGLKETYRWYLRNNSFPKPDFSFEDGLIATAPASAYSAPVD